MTTGKIIELPQTLAGEKMRLDLLTQHGLSYGADIARAERQARRLGVASDGAALRARIRLLENDLRWAVRHNGGECPADHPVRYAAVLEHLLGPDNEPAGLTVDDLGLSSEQTIILRDHLASRDQTVAEFVGGMLMEYGLGRATGREYPAPVTDLGAS